ncbi:hypothetical protein [Legionella impletisoli]|uniref:Substrate of the Dot/Icm secretion system n=1 Tax=Legionella impletisoli TaxID=343510 RepID=A0A917JP71_9GAMM|nr:hypothetical protein [Legionella impletisoli]GGI76286.1 hypothetical protein GCM10007966_01410 [Legionella impletisoli]
MVKEMKKRLDELREKERRSQLEEQEFRELMLNKRTPTKSYPYTLHSDEASSKETEEFKAVIDDYMDFVGEFAKQRPVAQEGLLKLDFPSPEKAIDFFQQQASKNRSFIVVDEKTNKVLAYSNGDGQLYHGDGNLFKPGDKLTRSEIDFKDFHAPKSGTIRP